MAVHMQHPTPIHQPAWSSESQQQQPQTLSSAAHIQEMHENSASVEAANNLSHNSSEDDFQHLFSSPLKFLAVLNEGTQNAATSPPTGSGSREQHNIDLEAAASDLGVVPFDVEDSYYNPLTSTPSVSQPHILRKSNSLGLIQRRKRENVSVLRMLLKTKNS